MRPLSNALTAGEVSHILNNSSVQTGLAIHEITVETPESSTSTPPRSKRTTRISRSLGSVASVYVLCRSYYLSQFADQLRRSRHPPGFGFRVDRLPIGDDIERTWAAHTYPNRNLQFALDVMFQAHGLCLYILSEEAAFDFNIHKYSFT
jgi:hypothetical protein